MRSAYLIQRRTTRAQGQVTPVWTSPSFCTISRSLPATRESKQFPSRAQAAQCLQSCSRVHCGRLGAFSGNAQVLPVFDVPNWTIRLIVVLVVIGLPVALVLAWHLKSRRRESSEPKWPTVCLRRREGKNTRGSTSLSLSYCLDRVDFIGRYTARNTVSAARTEAVQLH